MGNVPFRYDFVGSFLRPQALKDAKEALDNGQLSQEDYDHIVDEEVVKVVKKQKELGYHVITDGEFRRTFWHLDFMWGFEGVEHKNTGNIGKEANKIMQKKGTGFYAMYGVKMVDTYIPMYDASKNEKIESQIDPQIEEIITQIKERRIGDYLKGTVPVFINKACSFQYKQVRKTYNLTIDESCIHCGLCAKECPEQAIEIKDHVTFKKEQCMMCLRCLHHCPVNAIRFKNKDKGQYRGLL